MVRKYMRKTTTDSVPQAGKVLSQEVSKTPAVPMETTRSMLMQKAMNDRSRRIDLPDAMREKMESAFGMNFGKVNLYESERVADAGASAIAQGGNIAFAPGAADFNTLDGRNRLGHELSHIASQARGEVTGSGYLNNSALEARADREGALAAAGEQAYSGPVMDAPSFAGASAPMQASPPKDKKEEEEYWSKPQKQLQKQRTDNAEAVANAKRMLAIKNQMIAKQFDDKVQVDADDVEWYNGIASKPDEELQKALLDQRDRHVDTVFEQLFGNVASTDKGHEDGKFHVKDAAKQESAKKLFKGRSQKKKAEDRKDLRDSFASSADATSLQTFDKIFDDMSVAHSENKKGMRQAQEQANILSELVSENINEEQTYHNMKKNFPSFGKYNGSALDYRLEEQKLAGLSRKFDENVPESIIHKTDRKILAKRQERALDKKDFFESRADAYEGLAHEKDSNRLVGYLDKEDKRSRAGVLYSLMQQTGSNEAGKKNFVAQSAKNYQAHGKELGSSESRFWNPEVKDAQLEKVYAQSRADAKEKAATAGRKERRSYGDAYPKLREQYGNGKVNDAISKYGSIDPAEIEKRIKLDERLKETDTKRRENELYDDEGPFKGARPKGWTKKEYEEYLSRFIDLVNV